MPSPLDISRPRPTIQSIAKAAGVSHSTVSLVLNQRGRELRINPKTQQRILEIAREVNYIPNHLARNLRDSTTSSVGVLWSLAGPHNSEGMARRIVLQAQHRGYATHLADSLSDPAVVARTLAEFAGRCVDAVVLQVGSPSLLEDPTILQTLGRFKAAVIVSRLPLEVPCDLVVHDITDAMEAMADHLVASGRRRPAVLMGCAPNAPKLQAIQAAWARHGIPVEGAALIDSEAFGSAMNAATYTAALDDAAARGVGYDALICGNDESAAAAMAWLRQHGRRVPGDVALVGFNDSVMSAFLAPPLASVVREHEPLAEAIGELIFSRLARPGQKPRQRRVQMHFVWRESAGGTPGGHPPSGERLPSVSFPHRPKRPRKEQG